MVEKAKTQEWLDILQSEIDQIDVGNNSEPVSRDDLVRVLKAIWSTLDVLLEKLG